MRSRSAGEEGGILPDVAARGHADRPADAQHALEALASQPELLEPGLTALDTELRLDDDLVLDLLLRDGSGRAVAALFCDRDLPQALGRMAAVLSVLVRGRWFMDRLYAEQGLDAGLRPRFLLLAPRFEDPVAPLLDLLGGVDVRVLEYSQAVGAEGQAQLLLSVLAGREVPPVSADPEPARTSTLSPPPVSATPAPSLLAGLLAELELAPEDQALCRRVHESIASLSSSVEVSREGGRLVFAVAGDVLATLAPGVRPLQVQLDERTFAVGDEDSLHTCLNAVFRSYFTRYSRVD